MKGIRYIIADNVRLYQKRENLTQAELAEWVELSPDSIKRIEDGKRTISLENFIWLSAALRIQLSFFMYDQNDTMPETERINCILRSESQKNICCICCKRWLKEWTSYCKNIKETV